MHYLVVMQISQSAENLDTKGRHELFWKRPEGFESGHEGAVFCIFEDDIDMLVVAYKAKVLDYVQMRHGFQEVDFSLRYIHG
jgi:hypothetical protein